MWLITDNLYCCTAKGVWSDWFFFQLSQEILFENESNYEAVMHAVAFHSVEYWLSRTGENKQARRGILSLVSIWSRIVDSKTYGNTLLRSFAILIADDRRRWNHVLHVSSAIVSDRQQSTVINNNNYYWLQLIADDHMETKVLRSAIEICPIICRILSYVS